MYLSWVMVCNCVLVAIIVSPGGSATHTIFTIKILVYSCMAICVVVLFDWQV